MPRLVVMGEEEKKILYKEGMTVEDAIKSAMKEIPRNVTVTIDGKEANMDDEIREDSELIVTPKAKGG